jgi:hypothetical protein
MRRATVRYVRPGLLLQIRAKDHAPDEGPTTVKISDLTEPTLSPENGSALPFSFSKCQSRQATKSVSPCLGTRFQASLSHMDVTSTWQYERIGG